MSLSVCESQCGVKPSRLPSPRHGLGEPSGPERSSSWLPKGCHLTVVSTHLLNRPSRVVPGGVDEKAAKVAWAPLKRHVVAVSPGSASPWYRHWASALLDLAEVGLVLW